MLLLVAMPLAVESHDPCGTNKSPKGYLGQACQHHGEKLRLVPNEELA